MLEDPELAMFTVVLFNMGREKAVGPLRGSRIVDESGTAKRVRKRLMRRLRGEMSGHDLAREPGLSKQRDYRLKEISLAVRPNSFAQPLLGARRSRNRPVLLTRRNFRQQRLHPSRSRRTRCKSKFRKHPIPWTRRRKIGRSYTLR